MLKYWFAIIGFLPMVVCAQTSVQGTVKDDLDNPVLFGSAFINDTDSAGALLQIASIRNGTFKTTVSSEITSIGVTIKAHGFADTYRQIADFSAGQELALTFVLGAQEVALEEVTVEVESYPFEIKRDTVVYEVERYARDDDRKLEDVIANLPGMEVSEHGVIEYRGKPIQTVMIEGDNLFGSNYTLGTRNINLDAVAQIEAIERFNENPLLRDVVESDDVALNIRLKENRLDLSGSGILSGGIFTPLAPAINTNANALAIRKRLKVFGTGAFNTIGYSNSPFNRFSGRVSLEQLREATYLVSPAIYNGIGTPGLEELLQNFNRQLFFGVNSIANLSKSVTIRANAYYQNDRQRAFNEFRSQTVLSNDTINWVNDFTSELLPRFLRTDLGLTYQPNGDYRLEYDLRLRQQRSHLNSALTTQQTQQGQTELLTNNMLLKQRLLFTHRLANQSALQLRLVHASNTIAQEYSLMPSIIQSQGQADVQQIGMAKNTLEGEATYFSKNSLGALKSTLGYLNQSIPFASELNSLDSTGAQMRVGINELNYSRQRTHFTTSQSIQRKKLTVVTTLGGVFLQQNNQSLDLDQEDNQLWAEPSISLSYRKSDNTVLQWTGGYSRDPLADKYLAYQPILRNNRSLVSNMTTLDLQSQLSTSVGYRYNDLYKQQSVNASLSYMRSNGAFIEDFVISESQTRLQYIFQGIDLNTASLNLGGAKYIDGISTDFSLKTTFGYANYFNRVNDGGLRSNISWNQSYELGIASLVTEWLDMQHTMVTTQSQAFANNGPTFINTTLSLQSKMNFSLADHVKFSLDGDFIWPNAKELQTRNFFLNGYLGYIPEGNRFNAGIICNNLLGTAQYTIVQTNDYSFFQSTTRVLPRQILVGLFWSI